MGLEAQETNKQIYEKWLTEDFLLDEALRTSDEQQKLEQIYNYLQLLKEYDEELELE